MTNLQQRIERLEVAAGATKKRGRIYMCDETAETGEIVWSCGAERLACAPELEPCDLVVYVEVVQDGLETAD